MELLNDTLMNDARALLARVVPDHMPVVEEVLRDADGWGLAENLEDAAVAGEVAGEPPLPPVLALAEVVLGCLTSHLYDMADASSYPHLGYAAAEAWAKVTMNALRAEMEGR